MLDGKLFVFTINSLAVLNLHFTDSQILIRNETGCGYLIIEFSVEFILGLTGALIGSTVTIIIPSFLFIQVCDTSRRNKWLLRGAKVGAAAFFF